MRLRTCSAVKSELWTTLLRNGMNVFQVPRGWTQLGCKDPREQEKSTLGVTSVSSVFSHSATIIQMIQCNRLLLLSTLLCLGKIERQSQHSKLSLNTRTVCAATGLRLWFYQESVPGPVRSSITFVSPIHSGLLLYWAWGQRKNSFCKKIFVTLTVVKLQDGSNIKMGLEFWCKQCVDGSSTGAGTPKNAEKMLI